LAAATDSLAYCSAEEVRLLLQIPYSAKIVAVAEAEVAMDYLLEVAEKIQAD
jgi:hypothetical protein